MHIYLAGPLFTQAERAWNLGLAERLQAAGHTVFLPQAEVSAIASLHAATIFQGDVDGVRSADVVVAVVDGADADSGTSFEVGLAYALGIPVVLVRSDFRGGGDALPGQKLDSVNLMLSEAASELVACTNPEQTLADLAAAVMASLVKIPEALPRIARLVRP